MLTPKFLKFSFSSTLTLAIIAAFILFCLISLRLVRLKIGDYYFQNSNFVKASDWYGKVVRKERVQADLKRARRLDDEEPFSKLRSVLVRGMEEKLLTVSTLLGFEHNLNFKTLLTQQSPDQLDTIIQQLRKRHGTVNDAQKRELDITKKELEDFCDMVNEYRLYWKSHLEKETLGYLVSLGYFLNGIVDESEDHFISADSSYEKATTAFPSVSDLLDKKRQKILSKVADEYFSHSPSLRMEGHENVVLASESPLIIAGIIPGVNHYLEYETCPVRIILQKYSSTKLKIQGKVLGGAIASCIIPKVVFWGPTGYNGETSFQSSIEGTFDINFLFAVPEGTIKVTPRITFDNSCFSKGQKILVKEFKWH